MVIIQQWSLEYVEIVLICHSANMLKELRPEVKFYSKLYKGSNVKLWMKFSGSFLGKTSSAYNFC